MSATTIERVRHVRSAARAPLLADDHPCTLVLTDINGASHTIAISNEAIAQYLQRSGAKLMVEECSDFVSGHRAEIIAAAAKSLARRGEVDGRILLFAGDL